ncbi:MAG: DUF3526 domain-containing protein [Bacteroidota bacterium]
MGHIITIALKECKEILRERRFQWASVIVSILLIASTLLSFQYYKSVKQQYELAQDNARQKWLGQGERNPHSAAHFGTYAFKPRYPLSLIDSGIDKYAGVSIFLEAHSRNEAQYMAAQDQTGLSRFGDLTPDFILLFIIPLLIILLGFNSFTRERESGTLRLLKSQQVPFYALALGKWLGLFLLVLGLVLPLYGLAWLLLSNLSDYGQFNGGALTSLFGVYLLYFMVFINLTLLVSLLAKKSNVAFVSLLGIWMIACLVIPKFTTSLANQLHPYPTQSAFVENIKADKQAGLDGHAPWSEKAKQLEAETLEKYNVSSLEDLPFNWSGFLMQESEKADAEIYFKHYALLKNIYQEQTDVYQTAAALSPFLPTRFLSMAISRTDYHSHWNFADAAEKYRIELVGAMNGDLMENSRTGDWSYKGDEEVWASVPAFSYEPPTLSAIMPLHASNFLVLGFWLLATALGVLLATRQLTVV